ncbi:hypothetical protein BDN70DRAFT_802237 [Pholiota conissans]|uniref:PBP domain-containing protein n=1 Tax=Pholiota conissans TaxID=109636 RepID=A0A9P5Z9U6_9AGAR|nr:hypothetical protein BDN70DRAFT_802237 [Pholiota conissans]
MAPFDGFALSTHCPPEPSIKIPDIIKHATRICPIDESASGPAPYEIYDGGFESAKSRGICVRIANGTAGQIGLLRAWADAFIQQAVKQGEDPFQIAWYLGDSTESLSLLSAGRVDMALTYVPAAELELMHSGVASSRTYIFRDRFAFVGPVCNPAKLEEGDSIYTMFSKISSYGDADVKSPPNPDIRPATRFLSRCDKSATNLKESQIFLSIGQLPWSHPPARWYHEYVRFPREALRAAAALQEYTLIDFGAWLSAPTSIREQLQIFKMGSDGEDDVMMNPAHLLYRGGGKGGKDELSRRFYDWVVDPQGGLGVTLGFEREGQVLYSKAP